MDYNELYTSFFLNSTSDIVEYELLTLEHSKFSKVYRIVKNNADGLTVKLPDGESYEFEYYPVKITGNNDNETLDYIFKITLGDVGQVFKQELKNLNRDFTEFPVLTYYAYRSDNLNEPMIDPIRLIVHNADRVPEGVQLEAKAPSLNVSKTGEEYNFTRFPMLADFL